MSFKEFINEEHAWTKQSALKYIKDELAPLLSKHGYEVAGIVGGVEKKGYSDHDLDIKIRPTKEAAKKDNFDFEPILVKLGGDFFEKEGQEAFQYFYKGKTIELWFSE